jgi:outer membrane protein
MRVLAVVLALSVMLAALTFAQGAAPAPAQPAAQAPPVTAPAESPLAPPVQTQTLDAAPKPVPFQDGFKYAYVNVQQIAAQSKQGQDANARITALREKLTKELTAVQKQAQDTQKQLESQGAVLSDDARLDLQTTLDRQQRDLQRMVEDAEQDIERLTISLQQEFSTRLDPVIDRIAREKQVHMIFNVAESGLVWAAPGMDLTADVIAAFDTTGTAKPAASGGTAPAVPPPATGR